MVVLLPRCGSASYCKAVTSGRSRPSDKGGRGVSSRLWDKGGRQLHEKIFWPFEPHFGPKIWWEGTPVPFPQEDKPHHQGPTFPSLFEKQCEFFYVPFPLIRKGEEDKANYLISPPNDAIFGNPPF